RAPLARGDRKDDRLQDFIRSFQSAPLSRGATTLLGLLWRWVRFQSAPLSRGATGRLALIVRQRDVSIRAPLARGDVGRRLPPRGRGGFNPRPSREGRRPASHKNCPWLLFQSAPLSRGATVGGWRRP